MISDASEYTKSADTLVGEVRWQERVDQLMSWAGELLASPPEPLTEEDVLFVPGLVLALLLAARHAEPGELRPETMTSTLTFGVLGMAGLQPWEPLPPESRATWRAFSEWMDTVYLGEAFPRRRSACAQLFVHALTEVVPGVAWTGDFVKGYVNAASMLGRGGWNRILRKAYRECVLSGADESRESELVALLEGHRVVRGTGLFKTEGNSITPNFGTAVDGYLRELSDPLPQPAPERRAHDLLRELDEVKRNRLLKDLRQEIERLPARSEKSRSSRIVARHRMELLDRDVTLESLAGKYRVSPSPLHREWKRERQRLKKTPRVAALVARLRAAI